MKSVLATFTLLMFSAACSMPKYKAFSTPANFKTGGKIIQGKTPKEASQLLGKPMTTYFKDSEKSVYYMVYPMSEKEVTMTDIMLNKEMECLAYNFEKEKDYKYDGWGSDVAFACAAMKGEKLDTSLID